MKIHFFGTGSADHPIECLGIDPAVRSRTSTFIDDTFLFDCSFTAWNDFSRCHAARPPKAILFTHSHPDHLDVNALRDYLNAFPDLKVFGSDFVCAHLENQGIKCDFLQVAPLFQPICYENYSITALPANHSTDFPDEQPIHYLLESSSGSSLLYALDGGWMHTKVVRMLEKRKSPLNALIWDCALCEYQDRYTFEHNNLAMLDIMRKSLVSLDIVNDHTAIWLTHLSARFWPNDLQAAQALAAAHNYHLAADGLCVHT